MDKADEILAAIGQVAAKVDRIEADVAGLKTDVAGLKAGMTRVETDISVLQSGQDELRRVVAGNHLKVMGRIDELRDQLRDHIGGHAHKPAA